MFDEEIVRIETFKRIPLGIKLEESMVLRGAFCPVPNQRFDELYTFERQ